MDTIRKNMFVNEFLHGVLAQPEMTSRKDSLREYFRLNGDEYNFAWRLDDPNAVGLDDLFQGHSEANKFFTKVKI